MHGERMSGHKHIKADRTLPLSCHVTPSDNQYDCTVFSVWCGVCVCVLTAG